MKMLDSTQFTLESKYYEVGNSTVINANCFDLMGRMPEHSVHAIVTDPPYGVKEYDQDQLDKRSNGTGGTWRIPPAFDGHQRSPLPRFTALNDKERLHLKEFFVEWAKLAKRVLLPGSHILLASNAYLSQMVFEAIVSAGMEYRGQIIRLVQTLRGGDRPKNAEDEFPDVCTLPRGAYEPWGVFRSPLPVGMRVSDCLREYGTGGLRRRIDGHPFHDVIPSERTPRRERDIADHPSLKPQSFLRQLVYSSLPIGKGIVFDPFMGAGSTIAAAEFLNYTSIGVELNEAYYTTSRTAIPNLTAIATKVSQLELVR